MKSIAEIRCTILLRVSPASLCVLVSIVLVKISEWRGAEKEEFDDSTDPLGSEKVISVSSSYYCDPGTLMDR